jgi:hypothetical protein
LTAARRPIDYLSAAAYGPVRGSALASEIPLPRVTKDCFGTVISSLKKMKECVRCELLAECRSINWPTQDTEASAVIVRRPAPSGGAEATRDAAVPDDPSSRT